MAGGSAVAGRDGWCALVMAIASFVPTVWAARFLDIYYRSLVWGVVVNREYEGEIRMAGNTVKVPVYTRGVTVKDYTKGVAIAAAETPSGSTKDLVIDQQRYYHVLIEDIDRVQTRPDLWGAILFDSARTMAEDVDARIKTVITENLDTAANRVRLTDAFEADDLPGKLVKGFVTLCRIMDEANIPKEMRWAIVRPRTIELINKFFVDNESPMYLPVTNEAVLRNGFAGRLMGFSLLVTTGAASVVVGADTYDRTWCGQGNHWTAHAEQLMGMEAYRPESGFQDATKGLLVYGTDRLNDDYYYYLDHKQPA